MKRDQSDCRRTLPSFSIVIETENVSDTCPEKLGACLASLAGQDLSPDEANEVLLISGGGVLPTLLARLRAAHPWVTARETEPGADYYEVKMHGASEATGDVIIYCDSDCTYPSDWLREMLTPFGQTSDVQVVTGETTTPITGPFSLAMSLTYFFPRFSGQEALYRSVTYNANNVAFRREFLMRHPIPCGLPLYRGNGVLHYQQLVQQGHTIWCNPKARVMHPLPDGVAHFFWRFLLLGADALLMSRLQASWGGNRRRSLPWSRWDELISCLRITAGRALSFSRRIRQVLAEEPRRVLQLPLAIPIAMVSLMLFFVGLASAFVRPGYLLARFQEAEKALRTTR